MEIYPAHVVCGWIGNSEAVARKHYLQVTDAHFEKAVFTLTEDLVASQVASKRCKVTQTGEPVKEESPENTSVFRGPEDDCASVNDGKITRPGLEGLRKTLAKQPHPAKAVQNPVHGVA